MFKQLAPSIVEEMRRDGKIVLTVKHGWETSSEMHAIPYKINMCIGDQLEHLFSCYLYSHTNTIAISCIYPSPLIADKKNLIDGYLDLAIDGIIRFTKLNEKRRVIIDSDIKCIVDHLLHYRFKIVDIKNNAKSIMGILTLK